MGITVAPADQGRSLQEHISLLEKEHSDIVDRFEKLLGVKGATAAMMREEPIVSIR